MFGSGSDGKDRMELVRLAIPRRVYTSSHLAYVAEVVKSVFARRTSVKGFKMAAASESLRHFTAHFEPL